VALPTSIFVDIGEGLFSYRYQVSIHVGTLVGGTPSDDAVAEGWIRTKMGLSTKELVQAEVEKAMDARGASIDDAVEEVAKKRHLTGFKRNWITPLARADQAKAASTGFVFAGERKIFTPAEAQRTFGELYIEGRQLKAMFKEALMIGVGAGHIDATKWGKTSKAAKGFFAEHCFIEEEEILLGVTEPTTIEQAFVHTWRGAGIKLEEKLMDAELSFTIVADWDFDAKVKNFFGILLSIGERNGIGASRSQGYGRFSTTRFERVKSDAATTRRATARVKEIREQELLLAAERGVPAAV
jgi:hypothetical protein